MVPRTGSSPARKSAAQDAVSSLLLVAAAFLSSVISLLVLGGLLVLAEAPVLVRKAVLLISILFLALGQPHFVTELGRRFRGSKASSPLVSSGTVVSSLVLLGFGLLVSRAF